jgi:predicted hydrocarbon binding protein
MTQFKPGSFGVTLGPRVIQQLRASLERDTGLQAASYLQEAGFAGGEALHAAFSAWLTEAYGIERPGDLDAQYLSEALWRFFGELGWGTLSITPLGESTLAVDSADWAEALGEAKGEYPSCHLTCGLLADFLGRISEAPVAVMEVECRSRGDARCRFLAGSPETLSMVYERMAQGLSYAEALGIAAAGHPA